MKPGQIKSYLYKTEKKTVHIGWSWIWKIWIKTLNIIISKWTLFWQLLRWSHQAAIWRPLIWRTPTIPCPLMNKSKKFLCFMWDGQLWQFDCLPNGLALAPRKFTKLIKPVFAHLRQQGHISTAFLDDSLLLAESELACVDNIQATVQLLRSLRFIIHPDKSVLIPSQTIPYLGVIINSCDMTGEFALSL